MKSRHLFCSSYLAQRSLCKFFLCAIASALLIFACSENSRAQNLVVNGDFGTGDLSGWLEAHDLGRADFTQISYDGTDGVPAGSANWDRSPNGDVSGADNRDNLYQFIDVEVGDSYLFDAQWKGDLYGTARSWAEVRIAFLPTDAPLDPATGFQSAWQMYKKSSFSSEGAGTPLDPPVDGWDWESVHLSPRSGTPADNIYVATDEFMVVAFNLGGRDQTATLAAGEVFMNVDNVSVTRIPEPASIALLVFGCLATVGITGRAKR